MNYFKQYVEYKFDLYSTYFICLIFVVNNHITSLDIVKNEIKR